MDLQWRSASKIRRTNYLYLIATEIVPAFEAKMQIFDPNYRPGRAKALTPFQRQFKKGWKTLESRALGDRKYQTDVSRWTCSCGQQKYSALLLCKHLVQALLSNGAAAPRGVKRKRAATPGLEASSSRGTGRMDDPFQLSSSPIRQDEYLDEEDDNVREYIKVRILELQEGARILQEQLDNPGNPPLWLRSMKAYKIGQDVANMVADVRHISGTGTTRPTTWAKAGSKSSARYTRNTMGYQ
ncbi:hypothetical protein R3P38DRAFT_2786814 [Favolaschia claudopus]|uniref:SWIM-type domain-containing protein n=1 Tax=Favolaschia claudopus TaxID=2862362 RepID=A0AAW0ARX6_9AGAR